MAHRAEARCLRPHTCRRPFRSASPLGGKVCRVYRLLCRRRGCQLSARVPCSGLRVAASSERERCTCSQHADTFRLSLAPLRRHSSCSVRSFTPAVHFFAEAAFASSFDPGQAHRYADEEFAPPGPSPCSLVLRAPSLRRGHCRRGHSRGALIGAP